MSETSPVAEFQKSWTESSTPPDVFSFLATSKLRNTRQVADILLCDQYQRWKSGVAIPVENYFERCPELDNDEHLKVELIEEEFGYHEQAGNPPDLDEFLARFSFLSDAARDKLADSISTNGSVAESLNQLNTQSDPGSKYPAPTQISRFKILGTIGRGAFGVVYKGLDEELQRMVAIKVPTRRRIERAGGIDAFLKEARIVARLDHPAIVPVFDVGTIDDGSCYLVSKYIDGHDLKLRMAERHSFADTAKLVSTVAQALHHAHRQGLVHRDVKPANILIDKTGNPHLVDFGLALREEDFGHGSELAGTPAYMSPEQATGKADRVDARSDIYSLGIVLYELLTGRKPYRNDSVKEVIEQIKQGEIRPPRQLDDAIPQELDRICLIALAFNPRERYSTALDFSIDLDAFCESSDATDSPSPTASETIPVSLDVSRQERSSGSSNSGPGVPMVSNQSENRQTDRKSARFILTTAVALFALASICYAWFVFGWDTSNTDEPNTPADHQLIPKHVRNATEIQTGALTEQQVVQMQLDAASKLNIPTEIRMADRLILKLVPNGRFQMGSTRKEIDLLPLDDWFFKDWQRERMYNESPRHKVNLTRSFYMGAHETTIAQFRRFIESTGYRTSAETDEDGGFGWQDGTWIQSPKFNWKNIGFQQSDDHPVCNVSWKDANEYCKWLSTEEQAVFRLPTEAEWEYACRAGSTTWFQNGDRDEGLKLIANIADQSLSEISSTVKWGRPWNDGYAFSSPVGRFQPNALGLYDMHGNAWEWCQDWYGKTYYSVSPTDDPPGPTLVEIQKFAAEERAREIASAEKKAHETENERDLRRLTFLRQLPPEELYHVFRGGGWDNYPGFCRSADRYSSHSPRLRTNWAGFRVVRELSE